MKDILSRMFEFRGEGECTCPENLWKELGRKKTYAVNHKLNVIIN